MSDAARETLAVRPKQGVAGGPGIHRIRYYLGDAFVVEHAPLGASVSATGILLMPPLGYEDTCAYRPLRELADALARAGHVVLRLDWPTLGDSALEASEVNLLTCCRATVAEAARSLRARGLARLTGIGVRGGGLIAMCSPDLDDLVLWGVPLSGRAYLREERAFHQTAARAYGQVPEGIAPLPEGVMEAGGFLYSAETVAELQGLLLRVLASERHLQRVLMIGRDGLPIPADLLDAFHQAGTKVSTASIRGLGALLENSYQSELKPDIPQSILEWLAVHPEQGTVQGPSSQTQLRLEGGVTERPMILEGEAGQLSGILCEPPGGVLPGAAWTLFLNAGGIRRSGPNRLWTRAARALAADGRPSLRFDVRDVGDSDGAASPHLDLEEMYSESAIQDVIQVYDWVRTQGAGSIEVVGLCSGSFLGIQLAARREVHRAVLFNGLALVWNDDARASGVTSHISASLLDGRRWRRVLTGRIDAKVVARAIFSKTRMTALKALAQLFRQRVPDEVETLIRKVTDRGTEIHLISSEGDPSAAYLEQRVPPQHRPRMTILPGVDHTIRPVWAHQQVITLIKEGPSVQPSKSSL